jgi:hypothetical protein
MWRLRASRFDLQIERDPRFATGFGYIKYRESQAARAIVMAAN